MCDDPIDTRVMDYGHLDTASSPQLERRHRSPAWLLLPMATALLIGTTVCLVYFKIEKSRERNRGAPVTERYLDDAKAITGKEGEIIALSPIPPKHVIFRLNGEEVFRFTYEGDANGPNFSFELVEGSQ